MSEVQGPWWRSLTGDCDSGHDFMGSGIEPLVCVYVGSGVPSLVGVLLVILSCPFPLPPPTGINK